MRRERKPLRRRLGFYDAQDKVIGLQAIYRTNAVGTERGKTLARQSHRGLDEVAMPEPDEALEDAELSDTERQQAIARERFRRERFHRDRRN